MADEQLETLLVLVSDRISDIVAKGEVVDRYYNPGNLFEKVHIVLINDDRPDLAQLQRQVGTATLWVHNFPAGKPVFIRSLGWRPQLLKSWVDPVVELARSLGPQLVRSYGGDLTGFAAREIGRQLGIPYAVSLHITDPIHIRWSSIRSRLRHRLLHYLKHGINVRALKDAQLVMPVYADLVAYAKRLGVYSVAVHYNVINPTAMRLKSTYELSHPPTIVSVGRQLDHKNPSNIIRSLVHLDDVHLVLIGNGPLHDSLVRLAEQIGVSDRVCFIRAMPNDRVCELLPTFDLFVVHNDFWGIPKAVLEALLTGLPTIHNLVPGRPISELTDSNCLLVPNTPQGYATAIKDLLSNARAREELGRRAATEAGRQWSPAVAEAAVVHTYRKLALPPTAQATR